MARRRLRRNKTKAQRQALPPTAAPTPTPTPTVVIRQANRVERLAYTRTQAAHALGVSRSTFDRRVLPYVEVIEMPSGTKLVPIDELKRLLTERRRRARPRPEPRKQGRPAAVPPELVDRIRAERAAGKSLGQIARELNDEGLATAQGGRRWWPSTVRSVLVRSSPPSTAGGR